MHHSIKSHQKYVCTMHLSLLLSVRISLIPRNHQSKSRSLQSWWLHTCVYVDVSCFRCRGRKRVQKKKRTRMRERIWGTPYSRGLRLLSGHCLFGKRCKNAQNIIKTKVKYTQMDVRKECWSMKDKATIWHRMFCKCAIIHIIYLIHNITFLNLHLWLEFTAGTRD